MEDGLWSAKTPTIRGVYGVGVTAEKAKRDMVEALQTMADYLKKTGESRKAAACNRLVKAWKTKTR